MSEYAGTDAQPELTDRQKELLGQVSHQQVLDAFNDVLAERNIPLLVRRVEFREAEPESASEPIGPDPSAGPDIPDPPPGGAYHCWQDVVGGPWICECLPPSPPGPPVSLPPQ
jgi:hypothetical protein